MYIPTIYLLFSAEIIFILLAFCSGLLIYVYKLSKRPEADLARDVSDDELEEAFDLSTTYTEYIEQEMQRNADKLQQQTEIEDDLDTEAIMAEDLDEENKSLAPAPDESQSELLKIRQMFLDVEKDAANYQEHEIHFWDNIYKGMAGISEQLKTIIDRDSEKTQMDVEIHDKPEVQEKVFYIETQGKKVDGEVNKLKDIIFEQENTLNAMRKSFSDAESNEMNQEALDEINAQINALEAQLNDSKMCMEVLEMENDRLQEELNQLEAKHLQQVQNAAAPDSKEDAVIDLSELQDLVDKQQSQIDDLNATIDTLQLDSEMAQKMKETISDFSRSSQEMMGCISILEDENKHFKELLEQSDTTEAATPETPEIEAEPDLSSPDDMEELNARLQEMEEEIIKKDVAYAQLQEEFESMEKEYLSMYEAMHGDNS